MSESPLQSADMLKLDVARMRSLREAAGLSQTQAAKNAGMTVSRWNDIESGGRSNVTIETLGLIAKSISVDPRELLTPKAKRGK
jgi:transcriptional regulator with XRE-family HTH domain